MIFSNNNDQFQRNKLLCQTCFKTFDGFLGSVVETIGELERYNETIGCHYKLAIVGGQIWRERQKLGRPVQTIAIIVFSPLICSSITIRSEYFSRAITLIRNFSQVLLSIAFTVIKKILLFFFFLNYSFICISISILSQGIPNLFFAWTAVGRKKVEPITRTKPSPPSSFYILSRSYGFSRGAFSTAGVLVVLTVYQSSTPLHFLL